MSWPQLSTLIEEFRGLVRDTSKGLLSDNTLVRMFNIAERDVAAKTLCVEEIKAAASTNGNRHIALDYGVIAVHAVEYVPGSPAQPTALKRITPLMFGNIPTVDNVPKGWCRWGSNVLIEPVPAAAYNFVLYQSILPATEMTPSSIPTVPESFIPLMQQCVMFLHCLRFRQYRTAIATYNSYVRDCKARRDRITLKYHDLLANTTIPGSIEVVK